MTITQDLFDRQVEHLILTRRYQDAARLLIEQESSRHRGLLSRLFGARAPTLTLELEREVTRHVQQLYSIGASAVGDYIGAELDFQVNSLRRSVDSWYTVQTVNRGDLARSITAKPLKLALDTADHDTLHKSFMAVGNSEMTRINARIRRGIAAGKDDTTLVADVLKTTRLTEQQAKTLVVTHFTQAESTVKAEVARVNSDLLSGFVFTAILDGRTSKICSSYDGLVQPVDNVRIRPPLHWNCRSTLAFVIKPKSTLLQSNSPFINKAKLALVEDSRLSGRVPAVESFTDWLRRQTMATKMSHLGSEEKVALLESGSLTMADFFSIKGNPISLAALRVKDNIATYFGRGAAVERELDSSVIAVSRPFQLVRSPAVQRDLQAMIIGDTTNAGQPLSLVDYRGTTLGGKRSVRIRTNNEFDPRNSTFDPFTGESRSTLYYNPDFTLYQERLDYMHNSKLLDLKQKAFIEEFANKLEDRISVNQQSAVVETLRVLFERYQKTPIPWENFQATFRAETNFSVVNVSRLLDRRSRARDELFLGFKGDPNEPAVQVNGVTISIKELMDNKRANELFAKEWTLGDGTNLARRMYYTANAPWKSYFFGRVEKLDEFADKLKDSFIKRSIRKIFYNDDPIGFYTRYGKTPPALKKIVLDELKKLVTPSWLKSFLAIKEEGVFDFLRRTVREKYRAIVDMEYLRWHVLRDFEKEQLKELEGQSVGLLARMFKIVGEGRMTDYDGLAIALGREAQSSWGGLIPYLGTSLQNYHAEGSRILEYMRKQGLIRVNSRGVTRRAVTDLETGRASGFWKDTVSREVVVLDPSMLKLQSANRQLQLANRFGVDRPSNAYTVIPNSKNYINSRGEDSGVSLVTRSAAPHFDAKQLDGDFSDMLNHTMSLQYEVDAEFSGFMDDLVRFKDPRGRAAHYDELNGFREEIIRRGDGGYGLMEAVRYYRSTGKPFTVIARIDGRGRVYYNGYLTPTGGEIVRPFLNSAAATAMTPEGLFQLRIQMASVLGPATEALTNAGRLEIFKRHEADILKLGELMSATTQRDRRIREFLDSSFIQSIDPEEIAKIARFSLEYYRIHKHTGGVMSADRLATYYTKLMGEADASASGLQVISLSTGNRLAALSSNVLPTSQKNRIYDLVAMDVVADPRFQTMMDELGLRLTWEDLSKAAKYQVMITFYGAGQTGQTARVAIELAKVLRKRDIVVTTRAEFLAISKQIDVKIKEAEYLGALETKADLLAIKKELAELVDSGDSAAASAMLAEAEEIHPAVADLVRKYTDNRGAALGPAHFKAIARLMTEKLAERAPVTQTYIDFWKRIGQDYARTTKKVRIPWVTFDGKTLFQDYRPKIQQEIRFFDPASKRYIRNIYQMDAEDGKLLGKGNIGDVRLGLGVNGNHALDAALVRGYHLEGRRLGMGTSSIHDAIFQNINELPAGIDAMMRVYARARDSGNILATLNALRKEGFPDDLYFQYLQEARDSGFLDQGFTSTEILAKPGPGLSLYAFGP